jgi:hypothetical protein
MGARKFLSCAGSERRELPRDRGLNKLRQSRSHWKERVSPPMAVLGEPYPIRDLTSTLIGLRRQGSTLAPG